MIITANHLCVVVFCAGATLFLARWLVLGSGLPSIAPMIDRVMLGCLGGGAGVFAYIRGRGVYLVRGFNIKPNTINSNLH